MLVQAGLCRTWSETTLLVFPRGGSYVQLCTVLIEPVHGKTNNLGFRPGLTKIRLCSHRRLLETANFGFRKKRNCTIHVAKTKALISFAVTAKLICAFVFAYADCWFSHGAAQFYVGSGVPASLRIQTPTKDGPFVGK